MMTLDMFLPSEMEEEEELRQLLLTKISYPNWTLAGATDGLVKLPSFLP